MKTTRLSSRNAILFIALVLSTCNLPLPAKPTPGVAPITPSASAALPEHRIGVRVANGVGEFYDRQTGEKFVPRGNNYIRLGLQQREDGSTQIYHSVFDPGVYDSGRSAAALEKMHSEDITWCASL